MRTTTISHKSIKSTPTHASGKHQNSHERDMMLKTQSGKSNILPHVTKTSVPRFKTIILYQSLQAIASYPSNTHKTTAN